MAQKFANTITAKYRIPALKKYKNGWRIVFWYLNDGVLERGFLRVDKYRKNFERAKDAEVWINENLCIPLLGELQKGWTPLQGKPTFCKSQKVKLTELADMYLDDAADKYAAKMIGATTYAAYKSFCGIIKGCVNAESGGVEDVDIQSISKAKAERFIVQIKAQREWSTRSANNFLRKNRMLFKFAVDNGLLAANPFEKVPLLKGEQKGKRPLTKEEQTKIYTHLAAHDLPFLVFTQLVYCDLIRPVEALRIQARDIRLESLSIILPASKTKNKKERIVRIPRSLEPIFAAYLQRVDFASLRPTDYLFYKDFLPGSGREPLPSTYSSTKWREVCQLLNLPNDCKLYGLRHTGITDLLDVLPANTVRLHADHADLRQTTHYANHESEQYRKDIADKAPIYGVVATLSIE